MLPSCTSYGGRLARFIVARFTRDNRYPSDARVPCVIHQHQTGTGGAYSGRARAVFFVRVAHAA
jgi:hypothetical protein